MRLIVIIGVGYHHDTAITSSLCHLCKAALSNQNAPRYHLNYVHGWHEEEATTSHAFRQTNSISTSSAISVPTLSRINNSLNKSNQAEETIALGPPFPVNGIKNEEQN